MANQLSVKQELDKIKQNQTFLIIGILLFTLLLVWGAVSLFASQQQTVITAAQKEMAAPLQPVINTEMIDELARKPFYTDSELANFTIYKLLRNSDGQKYVVPIDTEEEEFLENQTEEDQTVSAAGEVGEAAMGEGAGGAAGGNLLEAMEGVSLPPDEAANDTPQGPAAPSIPSSPVQPTIPNPATENIEGNLENPI